MFYTPHSTRPFDMDVGHLTTVGASIFSILPPHLKDAQSALATTYPTQDPAQTTEPGRDPTPCQWVLVQQIKNRKCITLIVQVFNCCCGSVRSSTFFKTV